jgi:ATP-dependent DNA helicase RecG
MSEKVKIAPYFIDIGALLQNMALPISIDELISGHAVESERIEFKEGWNPEEILHSLCAFANDINNWGGGYIIIGIKSVKGKPILPPKGLNPEQIDSCQRKLLELCHKITPNYFPVSSVEKYEGKHILVLWAFGGETRPYKAPKTLGKKPEQIYYVRRFASTVKANHAEQNQLYTLAAKVPFDDRINHNASIEEFNTHLIKSFLKEAGSDLLAIMDSIPLKELCTQMQIARGPKEFFKPVNAGLLLFTSNPEKYFKDTRIEVVEYQDEIGDKFTEKICTGPIHEQLREALRYIKNMVVKEQVRKIPDQAEAMRFFNYPYTAIEESLANAVYHKSYDERSPITVNIRPDKIEILSFLGPVPPIDNKMLKNKIVIAHMYRNRRIGDFLKEIDLIEGRSTGFPKIRQAMKFNGSPPPIFETNKTRDYFLTILPIHPKFKSKAKFITGAREQVSEQVSEQVLKMLEYCKVPKKKQEILKHVGLSSVFMNYKRHILPLIEKRLLELSIPDKPQSSNQKYKTTEKGLAYIK